MGNKNTIEFNGKVYDTLTGKLIKSGAPAKTKSRQTRYSDGFFKTNPGPASRKPEAAIKVPGTKPASRLLDPKRKPAKQQPGHKPARSLALIRASVKKPAPSRQPIDQVQTPASYKPVKHLKASPIASRVAIVERRLVNANQTAKSSVISHFKAKASDQFTTKLESLPLKKPVPATSAAKPGAKSPKTPAGRRLDNILAAGLARANSHQQPAPKITKSVKKAVQRVKRQSRQHQFRRRCLIISIIVVVLLAGGFLLDHFSTNIKLEIATVKSGVHFSVPSSQPAGFSLDKAVKNANGSMTVNFRNKTTGQQFYIVARNSNWDSQTLLDSVVLPTVAKYQTLEQAGRTVYKYAPGVATWVNGGVWYEIGGDSNLTDSQLLAITTSM